MRKLRLPPVFSNLNYYRKCILRLPLTDYEKARLLYNAGLRGHALTWVWSETVPQTQLA